MGNKNGNKTGGYKARTRDLFTKGFRKNGEPGLATYLVTYRKGDIVDIVCDPSIQRGQPHKHYHGKTGRVWNVTKRSVGVVINKQVNTRIEPKRIHVRIEHVQKSKSRDAFLARAKKNDQLKEEANKRGEKVNTKRIPEQPVEGHFVSTKRNAPEYMAPEMYVFKPID